jgi:hypothetical protein
MEDSGFSYKVRQQPLFSALALQASWFFYSLHTSSKSPEPPRKASNLSPKPVPKISDDFAAPSQLYDIGDRARPRLVSTAAAATTPSSARCVSACAVVSSVPAL